MKRVQPVSCDLSCGVCYEQYNRADKQPMIVCSNHHSICKYCLVQLQSLLCPFCRQVITYATVNQSLQNLLPNHSPNQREPVQMRRFNPPESNNQLVTYYRQNEVIIDEDFQQHQNEWIEDTCYQRLRVSALMHIQKPVFCALLVQLPFVIFDLLSSKLHNDHACMDEQYYLPVTARQLFFACGIAGASITLAFFLIIFLSSLRIVNPCVMDCLEHLIPLSLGTKLLFWMIAEPIIFLAVIKDHCSGVFQAYCLIQALLFAFILSTATFCSMLRQ